MNSGNPNRRWHFKNGYLNEHLCGHIFQSFIKISKITENDISMDGETIALFAERRKNTRIGSPPPPKISPIFNT